MSETDKPAIKSPSSTATAYRNGVIGFLVWFPVGLAPFLGFVKVPLFVSLLEMYPESMRTGLISVSGLLMGMMAVTVENAAASKGADEERLNAWFLRTLGTFIISFLLLVGVYYFTVVHIDKTVSHDEIRSLSFVTGSPTVPHQPPGSRCGCQEGEAAEWCLKDAGIDPAHIKTCFGPTWVTSWTCVLVLLYLFVTGSMVASVGVLVLRRRLRGTE